MKVNKPSARVGALFLVAASSAGAALAQTSPSSVADCRGIAASMERLACYDAVSGRAGDAPKGAAGAPAAASAASTASVETKRADSDVVARPTATSMIDTAWGFDPASPPYEIRFYNANYLLFGRYSDNVNNSPFSPLVQASGREQLDLNSTEAKFQISFKARVWTSETGAGACGPPTPSRASGSCTTATRHARSAITTTCPSCS